MTILTGLTACAPSHAGAKAAVLGRLQSSGLPVPDSVVIPVGVADRDLPGAAGQVLAWAQHRAPYGVIARSSAPGEDGVTSSFAGLYDSVVAPCTAGQVLAALRQVRASARAPVVAEYAAARGLRPDDELAVLVQPVLRPAAAGVLAAQVADGRCARWRIEAVRGLAEQLVSGVLTGETHCGRGPVTESVARSGQPFIHLPGTSQELDLPPGEWITVPAAGTAAARAKVAGSASGVVHLRTPAEWADTPVLAEQQREELLDLAARAAQALGLEQIDMEWAVTDEGPVVVQARPLTQPIRDAAPPEPPAGGWAGLAGVAGIATGPAARLGPDPAPDGAVLLCGALGPEAAAALLRGPAAVVSSTGGPLSHTAIIARELGIPCVTNVPEAVTRIPAGMVIEVDGTAGTVRPAPTVPSPRWESGPESYSDAAVLTNRIPDTRPVDGRAATLVLHDPHSADLGVLVRAVTTASLSAAPLGILLPDGVPPCPVLITRYPGFVLRTVHGLALLWPQPTGALPRRVVTLDSDNNVIFERPLNRSAS
ncbi:PEP/pyruvate-binding domain-containing protein [Streptomyces sp. H10-C2]|uniref:PEP/pyruvate-binding domain-containing protein n=1 Tax=Streptomyces sp. H10-C2 TaxID=3046210 RepID=UPI0024B9E772|nr:PEP/pyruvate-binding domain-containing protein [Streptomyces sp. H10-C2]MDJ0372469.1 PEP/pyruvate-binding domain-containing protein [Streptomyces sp. H10-C2]